MSNRIFYGIIAILLGGTVILFITRHKPNTTVALVGVATHANQGGNHIAQGTPHVAYNSELPSSGPHYADATSPAQWGIYTQELPAEVFLHNEEHGGVVITYKPDLPQDQVRKLQKLFMSSGSDKTFSAGKFIITPRAENKYPIELASWTRTYNLNSFDQTNVEQFYLQNVANKRAPESFAGPKNIPINQATL